MFVQIATSLHSVVVCRGLAKDSADKPNPLTQFWSQVGNAKHFYWAMTRITQSSLAKKEVAGIISKTARPNLKVHILQNVDLS